MSNIEPPILPPENAAGAEPVNAEPASVAKTSRPEDHAAEEIGRAHV